MLSAPWGTGKSYYIQNSLIPHLEQNTDKKCVVVSLYGLNDTKEISKAIYFETRVKSACVKNEKVQAGRIFGKTIIKSALSIAGIDLSLNDADLEKIIRKVFSLKPKSIIDQLQLKYPGKTWNYSKSARYGHFGRNCFPWEQLDKVAELQEAAKEYC